MDLIVVSDAVYFENEAKLINQLFEAGMAIFHLRKPGTDQSAFKGLIDQIEKQYHNRIALHQFHELSKDFTGIERLHFPEQRRKEGFKNVDGYTLSTSIHHLDELKNVVGFDYTLYGPVFNSISKQGYSGIGSADLVLPENSGIKIIGLGGIDHEKVQDVKLMGFDGVAVLGTIWNNKQQAVQNFKSLINSYKEHFN